MSGDVIEVRVPVTNTGDRDGREVVQLYASLPGSPVRRAPRELKGFTVVDVAAGQTAEAVIRVDRADLAYWDPRLGRWAVEGGGYLLAAGASSRDLRASVTVEVTGDDTRAPLTGDSSLGEWLADPQGAAVLGQALAASASGNSALAAMAADPGVSLFLASLPLSRLAKFPGSTFGPDAIEQLVAAANA
ncbi:fibronectin type III-like domain-contianing protein [Catellatospora bangladeshensis]|uniref:fibronectin type III-like domain-contianing protein n=1 Tax=Catellatospora bangladeshensis TaxID=310355 RepID=UPI0036154810